MTRLRGSSSNFIATLIRTLLLSIAVCGNAVAAPVTAPLLGGNHIDLATSPTALILTRSYLCTGLLIGAQEVITAGHCLEASADEFRVIIGQKKFLVNATVRHSRFNPLAPTTLGTVQFDLGMLVLAEPVLDVAPVPVLSDLPIKPRDSFSVVGRGINETPESAQNLGAGRVGTIAAEDVNGTVIIASNSSSSSSTCPGDSGGPLLRNIGGFTAIAGVVSAGTNDADEAGRCIPSRSELSVFVDLQSASSRAFLAQFAGIKFLSGRNVALLTGVNSLAHKVTPTNIVRRGTLLASQFSKLKKFADGPRSTLLNTVIRSIRTAASARTKSRVNAAVVDATAAIQGLQALGL